MAGTGSLALGHGPGAVTGPELSESADSKGNGDERGKFGFTVDKRSCSGPDD